MSTAIGKAALILTTDASRARSGMDQFKADASSWARSVGGGFRLGIAAPAAAAVGGILSVSAAIETLQELTAGGNAAKAFGLTAEQFTGIAGVAKTTGEGMREFIESLVTLGKVAAEGAAGKGEVAVQWFKDLNLNAAEFAGMRLDQQFFKVFEAIRNVEDPAARVRALMVAFGEDGGKYLLPLLAKSPDQLRSMAAGFAISGQQMDQARLATEALSRAQQKLDQLWKRAVIAAAPVFEFLANELTRTVDLFNQMEPAAVPAMTKILRVTAQLTDATKALTGVTLFAMGARLKFLQAELVARGAMAGGVKGALAGAAAAGVIELTVGKELRQAGGMLMEVGKVMLNDVGGASKRVEGFLAELNGRKDQTAAELQTARTAAAAAAVAAEKITHFDNAALLKGTAAEVSARTRYDMGGGDPSKRVTDELKKGNGLLKGIENGVKKLAEQKPGQVLKAV